MRDLSNVSRRDFLKSTAMVAAAAVVTPAFGQASGSSDANHIQRLTGNWEHYRGSLAGPWEVWHVNNPTPWQAVQLPHCFNAMDAVDPDVGYYRGPGWYRTRLRLDNPFSNGRTLLHFEGSGQKTQVFVDQVKAAEHIGGYDEFVVDITEAAAKVLASPNNRGEVPLSIACENSHDLEMPPSDQSDFNLYGGIYRYLNLVYAPAISIERLHVSTKVQQKGPAEVLVRLRLYNPTNLQDSLKVSVRILEPSGTTIHRFETSLPQWDGLRNITDLQVETPLLWSPSRPSLYRCEVTLSSSYGETSATERFGFRYFEFVDKGPFKLNGQRLLLRGTQRHEDHAGLGSAMPEDLIRKEMLMIKQMGANFVRLGHYQQSRIVLDLCDELGLIVWEEIPWCRSGVASERWQQLTRSALVNMIDQHYNHPSIILWGLGNENDWPTEYPAINKEKIRSFLTELQTTSHQLDPSRVTSIRRCDFCKDIPDVYSPSIWAGWYSGRYTDYRNMLDKQAPQVNHFLHIEWGGDGHARRHSEDVDKMLANYVAGEKSVDQNALLSSGVTQGSKGDWSETYVCNLFDWHLKEQENMPTLTGSAQWAFKDFSTPLRPENPVPRVNQKGVTERDLTPKEGYYVFQSYWAEEPMVHIYGHTWPIRWGDPGEKKLVKVYSNCEQAELFLNGKSQGTKTRNSQDFPAAGLHWLVTFRSGANELEVRADKGGKQVSDRLRFEYQPARWGPPARFELRENTRIRDQVTLEAVVVDATGMRCLDARQQVHFEVSGDGTLIDNLGINTASRQVELYNGRAEISLQCRNGQSVASVSMNGIPTAFTKIE